MADISRLEVIEASTLDEINTLLKQLSGRIPLCTAELLQRIVESPETELWVAKEEGKIVGMGEIAFVLRPGGVAARMESVVVDEKQRGKGYGETICRKLIERAKIRMAATVELSSRPAREAANNLYTKLGFELHETNSYQLRL